MISLCILVFLYFFYAGMSKRLHSPVSFYLQPVKLQSAKDLIFRYDFEMLHHNASKSDICNYFVFFSAPGGTCNFNSNVSIEKDTYRGNVLRVKLNEFSESTRYVFQLQTPIFEPEDELYISYWIRFSDDFDLGKGGKLPGGLYGIVKDKPYPSGGNRIIGDSGFSVRTMFYTRGYDVGRQDPSEFPHLYSYIYHSDMSSRFGERIGYQWRGESLDFLRRTDQSAKSDKSDSRTLFYEPGYLFVTRVKMNSVGERNGIVQTFLNGVKVFDKRDYMFSDSGMNKINRATFSFFYGGDVSWIPDKKYTKAGFFDIDDITLSRGEPNIVGLNSSNPNPR